MPYPGQKSARSKPQALRVEPQPSPPEARVQHHGLRLAPPLVINEQELNTALDILENAFKECAGNAHTADTLGTSTDRTD